MKNNVVGVILAARGKNTLLHFTYTHKILRHMHSIWELNPTLLVRQTQYLLHYGTTN